MAGDEFHAGTYEIESERRGYALEIAVDFVRMPYALFSDFDYPAQKLLKKSDKK